MTPKFLQKCRGLSLPIYGTHVSYYWRTFVLLQKVFRLVTVLLLHLDFVAERAVLIKIKKISSRKSMSFMYTKSTPGALSQMNAEVLDLENAWVPEFVEAKWSINQFWDLSTRCAKTISIPWKLQKINPTKWSWRKRRQNPWNSHFRYFRSMLTTFKRDIPLKCLLSLSVDAVY